MTETEPGAALAAEVRARLEATRLPEPAERKRIRKEAGLSLKRLGEELGVTETAVWHWENGTSGQGPSAENAPRYKQLLDKLAKAVGR